MADRLVRVVLRGEISHLRGQLKSASGLAKNTANEITGATREAEKFRGGLSAVGDTAGKIGLVAAAGVGAAIIAYANFDQAMSNVAATGEDARGSLDALRDAALDAGARTKFSATEAAEAVEALAKAGVSASDILSGGLDGALDLAAAGGLEVAQAAEIAATAMNQFNKTGADVPHIADLLAAAAGKAMGDVEDMGAAFKFVGPVAAQLGVSMEETSGAIALLAQNGVLGEQAGTSLRGMLTSLTSPSKIAADTMDSLGISMYDAQGNFIGLEGLAGQLQERMSGLEEAERNEALGRIFGNEQITAARILYEGGAGAVAEWTKQVDDSGYAAETAARKMDNLKGDAEQLMGALETALIGTGQGADGPLRMAVQSLTLLVDLYNELPGPVKTGAFAVLGLTAALGGTVWAASKAVNGIASARVAATDLGVSFENANKKALALRAGAGAAGIGLSALSAPAHEASEGLGVLVDAAAAAAIGFSVTGGPWGAALFGGAALLSQLAGSSNGAAVNMEELTGTLDEQTGAITENTAAWAAKQIQDSGAVSTLADMGISLATATDAVLGNADALDRVAAASKGADFEQVRAIGTVVGLAGAVLDGSDKQRELAEATGASSEAQGAAAGAFGETGSAAADAATEVQAFNDSLNGLLDPLLSQEDASNAWKDSMATLTEEIAKNGATLDDTTTKGRANQDAIRERVKALKTSVEADAEAGVSSEQLEAKMLRGAAGILKTAEAAGLSRGQVKSYLETLGLTPDQITTLFEADASGARKGAREAKDAVNSVPRQKVIEIRATIGQAIDNLNRFLGSIPLVRHVRIVSDSDYGDSRRGRATGGAILRATGGSVLGPGTGTSDSIPAIGPGGEAFRLSNGEHVFTAREVDLLGGQSAVYAMRAAIRSQQFAFAGGGGVGRSSGSPQPMTMSASLVGARVGLDRDGLLSFIDGRIEVHASADRSYDRTRLRSMGA